MAYMSQETKKELAPAIKAICKKYGVTASLGVKNHSTLVLNISKGIIDFETEEAQVNHYYVERHYKGEALNFLKEVRDAMNVGNFDKSDIMTDYFHVGWYISINVGRWDKPYIYLG